jgi:hypothetical protein
MRASITIACEALRGDQLLVGGALAIWSEHDPPPLSVVAAADQLRSVNARKAVAKYPEPKLVEFDTGR